MHWFDTCLKQRQPEQMHYACGFLIYILTYVTYNWWSGKVVVVVDHSFPLVTQDICEASPSDCVAHQPLNLSPVLTHCPASVRMVHL
jgi:hypothetical protein